MYLLSFVFCFSNTIWAAEDMIITQKNCVSSSKIIFKDQAILYIANIGNSDVSCKITTVDYDSDVLIYFKNYVINEGSPPRPTLYLTVYDKGNKPITKSYDHNFFVYSKPPILSVKRLKEITILFSRGHKYDSVTKLQIIITRAIPFCSLTEKACPSCFSQTVLCNLIDNCPKGEDETNCEGDYTRSIFGGDISIIDNIENSINKLSKKNEKFESHALIAICIVVFVLILMVIGLLIGYFVYKRQKEQQLFDDLRTPVRNLPKHTPSLWSPEEYYIEKRVSPIGSYTDEKR